MKKNEKSFGNYLTYGWHLWYDVPMILSTKEGQCLLELDMEDVTSSRYESMMVDIDTVGDVIYEDDVYFEIYNDEDEMIYRSAEVEKAVDYARSLLNENEIVELLVSKGVAPYEEY